MILGLYFKEGRIYRIACGPLKGMKMYYDSSVNFHAILGLWDLDIFEWLENLFVKGGLFKESMIVCDAGANIGIYSFWFTKYLPAGGQVYSFEPLPNIAQRLRENLLLNNITNATVAEYACSDWTGETDFFVGHHHQASSLCVNWASESGKICPQRITVKSITLDSFFYETGNGIGPDFIKMDINGGGVFALKGCHECITHKRPFFLIESHTPDEDRAISDMAVKYSYKAYRLSNHRWVRENTEIYPHPEGIWGDLFLCPEELYYKIAHLNKQKNF
jgi:FkbM family methyltransferase